MFNIYIKLMYIQEIYKFSCVVPASSDTAAFVSSANKIAPEQ
jgi:hypothetical protein